MYYEKFNVDVEIPLEDFINVFETDDIIEAIGSETICSNLSANFEDEDLFEMLDMRVEINSYKSIIEELPKLDQDELGMLIVKIIKELK